MDLLGINKLTIESGYNSPEICRLNNRSPEIQWNSPNFGLSCLSSDDCDTEDLGIPEDGDSFGINKSTVILLVAYKASHAAARSAYQLFDVVLGTTSPLMVDFWLFTVTSNYFLLLPDIMIYCSLPV